MTTIYHNPRCSKSRQTLSLLEEKGLTPTIVLYLKTPPTKTELRTLLTQLAISARQLLRKNEACYRTLNLEDPTLNDEDIITVMAENPKLIERPIVVHKDKAVIGRPPESIEQLFT
ncbi:MAG TPA: arsenate reductase (glutaredoxin) [Gammaproteobacteria bacterium]|nr:arsenate reductase (glutaredoxin) [Gammaproteobacteria bacterium]HAU06783.1 arsenate reductase (glutaredoxin) [Gammaproteobacteria bacterium]